MKNSINFHVSAELAASAIAHLVLEMERVDGEPPTTADVCIVLAMALGMASGAMEAEGEAGVTQDLLTRLVDGLRSQTREDLTGTVLQ